MTFNSPPIQLPLEFVFDFHLENNPDHVAITYPTNVDGSSTSITYRQLVPAIHRAGRIVLESASFPQSPIATSRVVILIVKTDSITYLTVIAGILRAGLTPFPISSRFPTSVLAHLLKESHPAAIIFNDPTRASVEEALNECELQPVLCGLPSFSTLFQGHNTFTPLPKHARKQEDICALMHSSSSSAIFPKLIPWSSITLTHHGEVPDVPLRNVPGTVFGCYGMEMFHSYGMCVFFTMVRRGLVLAMMDPAEPTSILPVEASDVYRCFQIGKPEMLLTNPRAIEEWAEDPDKVAEFRDSGVTIHYGGRFLNKNVGDRLVKSGVRICTVYGGTETGPMLILPYFQREDWEYFSVAPRPDINFVPRGSDDLFELFVSPTEKPSYLSVVNAVWKGQPAYNPGDLFLAHPSKPNTYKMFGRINDQIMLATGQAINPIDTEEELSKNPFITSAVLFGHTRFKLGLVVEAPDMVFQKNEQHSYLDTVWPIVDSINKKSPPHASVSRDMIILASPSKPISMGPKGYPRRPIVWLHYQDEIDALYVREGKIRR